MNADDGYAEGAQVWIRHQDGDDWYAAAIVKREVSSDDGGTSTTTTTTTSLSVEVSVGGTREVKKVSFSGTEVDTIKLRNDVSVDNEADLINLPYLHEPAILHCLQTRYRDGAIYTFTGPILLAVNPFQALPLYTSQILEQYYTAGMLKSQGIDGGSVTKSTNLGPHVFSIADAAYREMMRLVNNRSGTGADQTILISGESGAGKTETTKIVLRYVTTVGNPQGVMEATSGSIMDRVLQSNPILEAFGNAKTLRNDNSSRFGKFIELHFSKRGHLIGAVIRTYLLEQVRLVKQQAGERCFHVFYQIMAGSAAEDKAARKLTQPSDFHYINQGATYSLKHFDDAHEYGALKKAWDVLGFSADEQKALLDVMAALLHLSEVTFEVASGGGDGSAVSSKEAVRGHLATFAELTGLPADHVERALTVRTISTRDESYEIRLSPAQACDARDAIAKSIYSKTFNRVVERVNASIKVDDESKIRSSINCLDIFGFECFKTNSFEQLCINYCNEQLQQQFNQFVFKMEQAEYERERIEWSFIEFPDNQDCLDLIEHRSTGILAMLDDECKLPKASDDKFAARLYKSLETHGRFTATTAQKRDMQFCIRHYAGPVVYNAASFIEKNKDELPKEAAALLCSSRLPFLSHIYTAAAAATTAAAAAEETGGKKGAGGSKAAHSVGAQFKEQLSLLMKSIQVTTPHYIRCLKPNDQNVSDKFDRVRTTEQLRYGGVLEAVRVARSGFPVRLVHAEFFARYRVIANPFCGVLIPLKLDDSAPNGSATSSNRAQDLCKMLLRAILDDKTPADAGNARAVKAWAQVCGVGGSGAVAQESVQLGLTKVFLRKTAHDTLEGRRTRRLKQATLTIQCKFRSHQQRKWYVAVVRAVPKLQKVVRGFVARRKVYRLRRTRAAVLLQSFVRAAFARRRYARFRGAAVRLQSGFRGRRGRAAARVFRQMRNALRVQSALRCGVARIRYLKLRRAVVALQCCVRRRRARKVLKARRAAAKDVGKLQTSNEALKKEIEELRIRAAEEARKAQKEAEERASVASAEEIVRLREELEVLKATLDVERTGRTADRSAAAAEVAQLQSERQAEAAARSSLEKEVASLRQAETSLTGRLQEAAQREAAAEEELHSLRAAQSAVPAPSPVAAEHERAGDPPAAARAGAGATELSLLPPPPSATSAPSSPKVTKPGPSAAASSGSPAVSSAVIATFEKNLASLRSKLRQGLKAQLWEEGPNVHIQNFECVLQLDKTFEVITFTATATRSAFALFATQKVEVAPVKIANIVDCHPGAASLHDQGFSSMFGVGASHSNSAAEMMTLIVKVDAKKDFEEPPRVIALRLPQREDRNHLMTALRTMISDLHVNTPTMRLLVEGAKKGVVVPTTADKQPQVPRRSSVSTVSPSGGGAAGVEHDLTNYESATDMKKQLLLERSNYERLMLQLFALTNDLNEREETITALKKRVATLEQTLAANEKMHEQDALIRLQLGKRLEQVLMDKEEALEELDMVQTKLESIRSAMQLVDFSKASALAETITKSPTRSSSTRG